MEYERSLAAKAPELAAQWHPVKNGELTPERVSYGSGKRVWWTGPCGHEWDAKVADRYRSGGCPYCSGRRVLAGYNDMMTTEPELAAQWHPTKNAGLTPRMVMSGSQRRVWWVCANGHEWLARIMNRSNGNGCPYCSHRKPSRDSVSGEF